MASEKHVLYHTLGGHVLKDPLGFRRISVKQWAYFFFGSYLRLDAGTILVWGSSM